MGRMDTTVAMLITIQVPMQFARRPPPSYSFSSSSLTMPAMMLGTKT